MYGKWLQSVDKEKGLGMIFSGNLKLSEQCLAARIGSNRMLENINFNKYK